MTTRGCTGFAPRSWSPVFGGATALSLRCIKQLASCLKGYFWFKNTLLLLNKAARTQMGFFDPAFFVFLSQLLYFEFFYLIV